MNEFKKPEKEKRKSKVKLGKWTTPFVQLITGEFMRKDNLVNSLPFLFFLTFLGICYIANGYYAEKTIREIYKTSRDLKELRSEYITIKSDLEVLKQQSQVALTIKSMGLKESTSPPKKLVIQED